MADAVVIPSPQTQQQTKAGSESFLTNFLRLIPGVLLLAAVGYAGKFIEQFIARYGKAHHLVLPNIEYVLWAIVIGLVIANTMGVPEIFRAGVATYEFWLKAGIVLLGARFILGDILRLGALSGVAREDEEPGFGVAQKGFEVVSVHQACAAIQEAVEGCGHLALRCRCGGSWGVRPMRSAK